MLKKVCKVLGDFFFGAEPDEYLIDFVTAKREIQARNRRRLIYGSIIPYIQKEVLKNDGLLISHRQAYNEARIMFDFFKKEGIIDDLNRVDMTKVKTNG